MLAALGSLFAHLAREKNAGAMRDARGVDHVSVMVGNAPGRLSAIIEQVYWSTLLTICLLYDSVFYICCMIRIDNESRRVALALLAKGEITLAEATRLAGVSRQLMRHWAKGVQWERVRNARIATAWRKEMARGPRLVETTKARRDK